MRRCWQGWCSRRSDGIRSAIRIARASGAELHYVVGDHATDEGRHYLSPDHLLELVPDIAARDVYVCGPAGLTDIVTRHVRQAGVRRSHIHAERFAL